MRYKQLSAVQKAFQTHPPINISLYRRLPYTTGVLKIFAFDNKTNNTGKEEKFKCRIKTTSEVTQVSIEPKHSNMFDIYESTSAAKTILDLILDGITFEKVDVKKEESVERHSNICEFSFVPDTASKENFDLSTCHFHLSNKF